MDSKIAHELFPKTAADALAKWDAGENVFSVEMGGLGPGYEQCIQVLTFEIIRDHLAAGGALPAVGSEDVKTWGDAAVSRLGETFGFSGAQVGAARWLAYKTLEFGWACMIGKSEVDDRRIQVNKRFPVLA